MCLDLRQDFRALTMKCRPDWDLTTPGVREAWEEATKDGGKPPRGTDFGQLIKKKQAELAG